jgi:hypothetical protein
MAKERPKIFVERSFDYFIYITVLTTCPILTLEVFSMFDIFMLSTEMLLLIFVSDCCSRSLLRSLLTSCSFYLSLAFISNAVY